MSFLDRINDLVGQFDEHEITPDRKGTQTLRIPTNGTVVPFTFQVDGGLNQAMIALDSATLLRAEAGWRERRQAKGEELYQGVVIVQIVARGRVRALTDADVAALSDIAQIQDEAERLTAYRGFTGGIALPLEQKIWPAWDQPWLLTLKGQHQGVRPDRISAMNELLLGHRWVAREEPPENPERKTHRVNPQTGEPGFSLQTRGRSGTPEQWDPANGAIELSELVVRSARFTQEQDGVDVEVGFANFAEALLENAERYFRARIEAADDKAKRAEIEKGVFSITGAHTVPGGVAGVTTYLDSADIPEWAMRTPDGDVPFALWEQREAEEAMKPAEASTSAEPPFKAN